MMFVHCLSLQEESCHPSYCCVGSMLVLLLFLALTITGIGLVEGLFSEIGVTSRFVTRNGTCTSENRIGEVQLLQCTANCLSS